MRSEIPDSKMSKLVSAVEGVIGVGVAARHWSVMRDPRAKTPLFFRGQHPDASQTRDWTTKRTGLAWVNNAANAANVRTKRRQDDAEATEESNWVLFLNTRPQIDSWK